MRIVPRNNMTSGWRSVIIRTCQYVPSDSRRAKYPGGLRLAAPGAGKQPLVED